jgi:hypothetical protein
MPAVVQLNPAAAPFAAYATTTVLRTHFLDVELAGVRTILSQVAPDRAVLDELAARGSNEGVRIPDELTRRISYVFLND